MASTSELIVRSYRAFNARDIDAVLACLHSDVDWPNGWEGGRVHGHQGVREYWVRQWAAIDPHVEPIEFETDEVGRTAVTVRQIVRDLDGAIVSSEIVRHVYSIEDGLIRKMDIQKE